MKRGIKMTQWIDWASIGSFLSHVAVGLGLLFIGVMVFELTTKFNDRELIKKGNVAVALKLWGKGIGPNSILCMMDYAFRKLGITVFNAETHEANIRSRKMLQKIGFIEISRIGIEEYLGTQNQLIQYRFSL